VSGHGFPADSKPSNDNARVVSGKFSPESVFRPSSGSPVPLADTEFYYLDAGGSQIGPARLMELRAKFKSGELNGDCLFWYDGMSGWEKLGGNSDVMKHINPPPPPARPVTFGLKSNAMPPISSLSIAHRAHSAVPDEAFPSPPLSPPAAAHQLAPAAPSLAAAALSPPPSNTHASVAKAATLAPQSKPSAPVAKPDAWTVKRTADLVPYYYNAFSGALQWERPAELLEGGGAGATSGGQGGLVWVPDEVEGFIAARSIGGKSFQTLEGKTVTFLVPKGGVLKPVNQAALSLLQHDLVLLEDMSEGMILHNLRERYFKDQIYCGVGSILIAINPFKRLPLYTHDIIHKYTPLGPQPLSHSC
jgi:hypothetical protein